MRWRSLHNGLRFDQVVATVCKGAGWATVFFNAKTCSGDRYLRVVGGEAVFETSHGLFVGSALTALVWASFFCVRGCRAMSVMSYDVRCPRDVSTHYELC